MTPPDAARIRALVIFSGRTDLWYLRLLRPGFRHCFVVVRMATGWLSVETLTDKTLLVQIPEMKEHNLISRYRQRGLRVVPVVYNSSNSCHFSLRPYSCVETVKRVLGIYAPWVLTPWQLFRHLNKKGTILLTRTEP